MIGLDGDGEGSERCDEQYHAWRKSLMAEDEGFMMTNTLQ